ncbi:MAG TPA: L,D-transpeptidase family protein, partial [Bdellovibrionales bacterium]|nr:L,D-transpeptidase family protein [Bdellovibrionales bacterium]
NVLVQIEPVKKFLEARGFTSIWVDTSNRPTPIAAAFRELIQESELLGLNPGDYWSETMEHRWPLNTREAASELELLMTQSYLNFVADVATGRVNPQSVDNEIDFRRRELTDMALLNSFLANPAALRAGISSLEPQHEPYRKLKQKLAQLLAVKANGGWTALKAQKKLQKGMSSAAVPPLRKRLVLTGQLDGSEFANESQGFDEKLEAAVKAVQRQHMLKITGIADTQFYGVINVPVEKRIQQIAASIEKWKWLPPELGEKHVFVNLARAELDVYESGVSVMNMKVVVGKVLRRTPSLSDKIVDVALNPYWNVPQNLVIKDVLPGIKSDPAYLQKMNMKVFTPDGTQELDPSAINWAAQSPTNINFRFRQEPGHHNSLGIVKFNLTNSRAIYMHDTPHKELFVEGPRNFSSGCVRLERPVDFATYLLKGTEWTEERIRKFTRESPNRVADYRITLENPLPVYLVFLQVSFAADGEVRFASDNYGQDERLMQALQPAGVF